MITFVNKELSSLTLNPFTKIDSEWMLITAGNKQSYNTMTASWGGVGVLWNKNVSFIFIRPQRYTFEFLENNEYYSLSFFDEKYKPALSKCGQVSGRDIDKIKETGLNPIFDDNSVYFKEAKKVLICKKIYSQFITPDCFIDESLQKNYEKNDYHKMYIGEIVKYIEEG